MGSDMRACAATHTRMSRPYRMSLRCTGLRVHAPSESSTGDAGWPVQAGHEAGTLPSCAAQSPFPRQSFGKARLPVVAVARAIHCPADAVPSSYGVIRASREQRMSCPAITARPRAHARRAGKTAMKLTRLRLIGFKSFVEPTDFLIEPGLTGVVGPNGCGKSNLVEALRWVMGEASHKAMRAADMDDVIFSGNGGRPPRNTAEVAMTIDNSARTAPAQFNDAEALEVSRRIEREAGLDLPHQWPRSAGPRRANPVCRRLDRRSFAGAGAPGAHRRDHPGQARAAPPRPRRGRRHFRPACAPPRGGAAAARAPSRTWRGSRT